MALFKHSGSQNKWKRSGKGSYAYKIDKENKFEKSTIIFYNRLCQQDENKNFILGQVVVSHIPGHVLMSKICKDLSKCNQVNIITKKKGMRNRDGR